MEGDDKMKLSAMIIDPVSNEEFTLSFPLSRLNRDFSKLNVTVSLDGFDGHLQIEYNKSPVGPYQGPYDQNEALDLSIQLPDSDLDFKQYTEFRHSDTLECKKFAVKGNYVEVEDLYKIDALKIADEENDEDEENVENDGDNESDKGDEDKLHYTCQYGKCSVPCPCSTCCTGDEQCTDH